MWDEGVKVDGWGVRVEGWGVVHGGEWWRVVHGVSGGEWKWGVRGKG